MNARRSSGRVSGATYNPFPQSHPIPRTDPTTSIASASPWRGWCVSTTLEFGNTATPFAPLSCGVLGRVGSLNAKVTPEGDLTGLRCLPSRDVSPPGTVMYWRATPDGDRKTRSFTGSWMDIAPALIISSFRALLTLRVEAVDGSFSVSRSIAGVWTWPNSSSPSLKRPLLMNPYCRRLSHGHLYTKGLPRWLSRRSPFQTALFVVICKTAEASRRRIQRTLTKVVGAIEFIHPDIAEASSKNGPDGDRHKRESV